MEGPGNAQLNRFPCPEFFGHAHGQSDLGFLPGDDDLSWAVEVGHVDIGRSRKIAHPLFVRTDNGRHTSLGCITRLLHESGTLIDQAESCFKVECSRGGVGSEFAQGEAGRGIEGESGNFFLQNGERRQAVDIKGGLADRGLGQLLLRSLEGNPR